MKYLRLIKIPYKFVELIQGIFFSQFTKLRKKDQRQLLARNTPLYIQLYLSFYFSTPKGSELLEVIHATSRNPAVQFDHNCRMFQQWFRAMNMIFRSGANVYYYAQLFASLCALRLNCAKVRAGKLKRNVWH